MDLDEYLWRNKKKLDKFAKALGVSQACLSSIKHKKNAPSLLTALKIVHISKGSIKLENLLTSSQSADYENWKREKEEKDKPKSQIPQAWINKSSLEELDEDPEFKKFKKDYDSKILS